MITSVYPKCSLAELITNFPSIYESFKQLSNMYNFSNEESVADIPEIVKSIYKLMNDCFEGYLEFTNCLIQSSVDTKVFLKETANIEADNENYELTEEIKSLQKSIENNSIETLQDNIKECRKECLEQQIVEFGTILKQLKKRSKCIEEELEKEMRNKDENARNIYDKKENISKLISGLDNDKEFISKLAKLNKSFSKTEISNIAQVETLLDSAMDETIKSQLKIIQKEFKIFEEKQNKYIKKQIKLVTVLKQSFVNICEQIKNQFQSSSNQILDINKNKIYKIQKKINNALQQATDNLVESNSLADYIKSAFGETKTFCNALGFLTDEDHWIQHLQKISDCKSSVESIQNYVSYLFENVKKKASKNEKKLEESNTTLQELKKSLSKIDKNIFNFESNLQTSKNRASSQDKNSCKEDKYISKPEVIQLISSYNDSVNEYNNSCKSYQQISRQKIRVKEKVMEMDKNLYALKETLDRIKEKTLTKLNKKLEEAKEKLKSDKAEIHDNLNKETIDYKGCHIIVRKSDLTIEREDAIVNPANEDLNHEEGAARAIADKGGDVVYKESRKLIADNGKIRTGDAVDTNPGDLSVLKIIHAVGPRYIKGGLDNSLAECQMKLCTKSILELVVKHNLKSVSIPAISTGVFSFPIHKAAAIISRTIREYIDENPGRMAGKEIIFCNFDDETTNAFLKFGISQFKKKEEVKQEQSEEDETPKYKQCKKLIINTKHQKKGTNLKICYKCFKENQSEESEDDDSDTLEIKKKKKN